MGLQRARGHSCLRISQETGVVFKMYANEHRGEFPILSSESGRGNGPMTKKTIGVLRTLAD